MPASTIAPTDTGSGPSLAQATATATLLPTVTAGATAASPPVPTASLAPSPTLPATLTPPPTDTAVAAVPTADATRSAELYDLGLEVYREQFCGTCHTLEAAGTAGIFGPAHDEMGAVARERIFDPNYTGSATTAAEYIVESILKPKAHIVSGFATTSHHMPPYEHLEEEEILALVELLLK